MTKTTASRPRKPSKPASRVQSRSTPSKHHLIGNRDVHGKALRKRTPRSSHAAWRPPSDRRDPVEILIESSQRRVQHLVPIRYGRMLQSPFAFYRGSAAIMAADLSRTPITGLRVQVCGDCHLMNFGIFATPERHLIFDINDFDETLPGPWEWDIKRLAASFVIAGRHNLFKRGQAERLRIDLCSRLSRKHGSLRRDAGNRRVVRADRCRQLARAPSQKNRFATRPSRKSAKHRTAAPSMIFPSLWIS